VYAARIKCAGWGGPARDMRALCGAGLNGAGRPALPPLEILVNAQESIPNSL